VDDLGTHTVGADGMRCEYLHITRAGGRRVTAQNPRFDSPHQRMISSFEILAAHGEYQTHYLDLEKMDGRTKLLFSNSAQPINGIAKRGNDLIVGVGEYDALQWHMFRNGAIAEPVDRPAGFVSTHFKNDDLALESAGAELTLSQNGDRWKTYAGDALICRGKSKAGEEGLFSWTPPRQAKFITASNLEQFVASYDGKWCVGILDDTVVRLDLCTGKTFGCGFAKETTSVPGHIFPASIGSSLKKSISRKGTLTNIAFLMPQQERRCALREILSRLRTRWAGCNRRRCTPTRSG